MRRGNKGATIIKGKPATYLTDRTESIEVVPIDSISPHPENANEGDVGAVMQSMQENGVYGLIEVQRSTGYIVKGNTSWKALKLLGTAEVRVEWLDIDDTKAREILLADNEASARANLNLKKASELLEKIKEERGPVHGLKSTLHTEADLDSMLALVGRIGNNRRQAPKTGGESGEGTERQGTSSEGGGSSGSPLPPKTDQDTPEVKEGDCWSFTQDGKRLLITVPEGAESIVGALLTAAPILGIYPRLESERQKPPPLQV